MESTRRFVQRRSTICNLPISTRHNSSWGPVQVLPPQSHLRRPAQWTTKLVRFGYNNTATHHILRPDQLQNRHKHQSNNSDHYPQIERSATYLERAIQVSRPLLNPTKGLRRLMPLLNMPPRMATHPMPSPKQAVTKPPATGSIRPRNNSSKP